MAGWSLDSNGGTLGGAAGSDVNLLEGSGYAGTLGDVAVVLEVALNIVNIF